jgi:hypothetical protein
MQETTVEFATVPVFLVRRPPYEHECAVARRGRRQRRVTRAIEHALTLADDPGDRITSGRPPLA